MITGIAIMKLVEEGQVSLNDKVFGEDGILGAQYGAKPYTNRIRNITVNHLLHHLSGGWRNFVDDPVFDAPFNLTTDEMISWGMDNVTQAANAGTTYHYSNFGYVLGRVIEKASGKSYEEYVRTAILNPVGANNTYRVANGPNDRGPKEVNYYSPTTWTPTPPIISVERMLRRVGSVHQRILSEFSVL